MKKNTLRIISIGLIVIIIGMLIYVFTGTKRLEQLTVQYLDDRGYEKSEYELEVKHSFLNIFLSYNEWTINVKYNDEKDATYIFTIRNGKIVETGVTGSIEKEDLKHSY